MAVASINTPTLEKLYECAQTLSNAKGLVQNRVSRYCLSEASKLILFAFNQIFDRTYMK